MEDMNIGDVLKAIMAMLMGAITWIFKSSQTVQDNRLSEIEEQCKSIDPSRIIERVNRNTEDIADIKLSMAPLQSDVTKIRTILEERDKQWQRETGK